MSKYKLTTMEYILKLMDKWLHVKNQSVQAHWNENVIFLTKFSSLAVPKVVNLTNFSAAGGEDFCQNEQISISVNLKTLSDEYLQGNMNIDGLVLNYINPNVLAI